MNEKRDTRRAGPKAPAERERGAALVMVLLFGVAAFATVLLVLNLATVNIKSEVGHHRTKSLQGLIQCGGAAALAELNTDRLAGPFDPDADGVGTILGGQGSPGIEVRGADGRILGHYRTVCYQDDAGRVRLLVAAAYPDFGQPETQVVGELLVAPGLPPFLNDRNAFSIVGTPSSTQLPAKSNGWSWAINGQDAAGGPPVVAANITDPTLHAAFAAMGVNVVGADPANPGSLTAGAGSITNDPAGLLSTAALQDVVANVQDYVTTTAVDPNTIPMASVAGVTPTTGGYQIAASKNVALPDGTYVVNNLDIKGTLSGSGTLIVTGGTFDRGLQLLNGGRLDWTGQIIVMPGAGEAAFELQNGSRASINGTVAVVSPAGQEAELEVESGSKLNVVGSVITAAAAGGEAEFEVEPGGGASSAQIDGILALMGSEVELELQSSLQVNGSTVVALADTPGASLELEIKPGAKINTTYNAPNFDSGIQALGSLFALTNADDPFPFDALGYWELPADGRFQVTLQQVQAGAIPAGVLP